MDRKTLVGVNALITQRIELLPERNFDTSHQDAIREELEALKIVIRNMVRDLGMLDA